MSIIFCRNQPIITIGSSGNGSGGSSTLPGGSNTELQYRNGTLFGAIAGSSWDGTVLKLSSKLSLGTTTPVAQLDQTLSSSSLVGHSITLANGQTANAFEVKNNSGTTIFSINSNGAIIANNSTSIFGGIVLAGVNFFSSGNVYSQGNSGVIVKGTNANFTTTPNDLINGALVLRGGNAGGHIGQYVYGGQVVISGVMVLILILLLDMVVTFI